MTTWIEGGMPDAVPVVIIGAVNDIRLFREKNAVQIVLEVLGEHGIVPELRLADTYVIRHYCVQFRESDLDFVHRLLEDEGIYYFLLEDGTMVLGDRASSYDAIPGIPLLPFKPGLGLDGNAAGQVRADNGLQMSATNQRMRPECGNI